MRILANYGPGCKPKALSAILDRLGDDDPTIVSMAIKLFTAFAPFNETERPVLVGHLNDKNVNIRLAVTIILTVDAPDAATAITWFRPGLADGDPRVRAKALDALAKWGPKAKECVPDLIARFDDDTVSIAVAAVKAVMAMGGSPPAVEALKKLLESKDVKSELKTAALDAAMNIDLTDAETGVPILTLLLSADKPNIRTTALTKLAKFGTMAKPALNAVTNLLKENDAATKIAALKIIEPLGMDAAASVPAVASLLDGKQTDAVAIAATETLVKLGPKAIDPLTKALEAKLPKDALIKICEGLGGFGKEANSAAPALLDAVAKQSALRTLAEDASGAVLKQKPWAPDPVAAALAKVSGDDKVAKLLVDWASFEVKTVGGAKKRIAIKGDNYMLWSLYVLNSFDPETLTQKGRDQVASQVDILVSYAPTAACREAAKAAVAKYPKK